MQKIEITTTHNVVIQYDLAHVWDRIFAYLIDFAIQLITLLILTFAFGIAGLFDNGPGIYFYIFIFILIYAFYDLIMEMLNNGQSVGKMALGIKVVRMDGKEVKMSDYLMRWIFRPIDTVVGIVAIVLISSTENRQRAGDILAHTVVIKTRKKLRTTLADVLNIKSLQNYEPQYQQVRKLSEQDMLLTKETIALHRKYGKASHKKALKLLTERLCHKMEIDTPAQGELTFLRTLLNDYIVLTR